MRLAGVPVVMLAEGGWIYARRRISAPPGYLADLLADAEGRDEMTRDERRGALGIDSMLRRLGVRCLWRAAITTEFLRRRGVAAKIQLSVKPGGKRLAHAECEVAGWAMRGPGHDSVILR